MQDRYFGDVGDFGKYGLLRALCGINETPRLRLGIVWYLYPDENHNQDGKHLGYLSDRKYRLCDETLYDGLRAKLLDPNGNPLPGSRRLSSLGNDLLPPETICYAEPLSFAAGSSRPERLEARMRWFEAALERTLSADIVFLDPDNGIECASIGRFSRRGPKYVY